MEEKQKTEYFLKYQKLLQKFAWSYGQRYNLEQEELYGQACLFFVETFEKFEKEKSNFGTFLFLNVKHSLKDYCNEIKRHTAPTPLISIDNSFDIPEKNPYMDFLHKKLALTPFSQTVIETIQAGKIERNVKNKITKQNIMKYFRSQGYLIREVQSAFKEIKEVLAYE